VTRDEWGTNNKETGMAAKKSTSRSTKAASKKATTKATTKVAAKKTSKAVVKPASKAVAKPAAKPATKPVHGGKASAPKPRSVVEIEVAPKRRPRVSVDTRPIEERIEERAFLLWLERGGDAVANWVDAEREIRGAG